MLHGVTVRSPVARGKITNISFDGDIPWDEFIIVTAKDIPGAELRRTDSQRSALPR